MSAADEKRDRCPLCEREYHEPDCRKLVASVPRAPAVFDYRKGIIIWPELKAVELCYTCARAIREDLECEEI